MEALMEVPMFRRFLAMFGRAPHAPAGNVRGDDTEYLRSSRANEARLNAAIEELDAGRGTLTSMSELRDRLREVAAR
jgi:hypothetical protein